MLFIVVTGVVVVVVVQYFINEAGCLPLATCWDMILSLRSLNIERENIFQRESIA